MAAIPLFAAGAALVRWWTQGSRNLYTVQAKRFYVPHQDLGWQAQQTERVWLGLDALAVLGISAVGVVVAAFLIARRERLRGNAQPVARTALLLGALLSFVVPGMAFLSGGRPPGARDALPAPVALDQLPDVIDGGLPVKAGAYAVVPEHASVVAKISAGKEEFDATFGSASGALTGDLSNLAAPAQPLVGRFEINVATIDTGISLRSEHAREYLKATEYPTIGFTLEAITAARIESPRAIQVRAKGTVTLMGQEVPVVFTGVIRSLDDAARARLGIAASAAIKIEGGTTIKISQTKLAAKQSSFDRDDLPIAITLVLQYANN